jgi:hypothetical protein
MAADDVYLALVKLDDPEVRSATSDIAQLGDDFEFSDEERQIVQDVIDEAHSEDEVSGFAGGAMFGAVSYCSGQVSPGCSRATRRRAPALRANGALRRAARGPAPPTPRRRCRVTADSDCKPSRSIGSTALI